MGPEQTRWAASPMPGVSKAEREFGFRAQTDFRAGLIKTIEWYREHCARL